MTQLFKLSCLIVIAIFIGCIRLYAYNSVSEISIVEDLDSVSKINHYTEIQIVEDTDSVIAVCESDEVTLPEYKGGEKALMQFIGKNIMYPSECLENDIEGKVVVKFGSICQNLLFYPMEMSILWK